MNRLAQNKTLQDKLYEENKRVLNGEQVSLDDKVRMPYHEATLIETTRYYSVLPLMLEHKSVTDTEVGGYKIPNGTSVWINMYAYSHDEAIWGDPYEFRPERFMNENGQLKDDVHEQGSLFFGAGPRVCPGEVFAKMRLFLMLSSIIQNFEILPSTTVEEQASCDVRDSVVEFFLHPGDLAIRLKPRKK